MKKMEERNEQIAEKLLAYLREEYGDSSIAYDSPFTQLQGGFDTATYRFKLTGDTEILNKELVLRLFPESRSPEVP